MIYLLVASSLNDPFPGWIDNFNGIMGVLIGGGKGILRVSYTNKHITLDITAVDVVIKCIIIVVWKLGLTTYDYQRKYQCVFKYLSALSLRKNAYEKKLFLFI